ncbi:MAG: fumarylacetoacetase [Rubrivivax sp.]|nr:fumarylacetoacetase [Rubrivivax sp.]
MSPDGTHDPVARSWVPSAQRANTDFPLQNLPHGVFRRRGSGEPWRGGVAIGSEVLDLRAVCEAGVFDDADVLLRTALRAAAADGLNELMSLGRTAWRALRAALFEGLRAGSLRAPRLAPCLVPQGEVELRLPARIGDFTDFFTSHDHMRRMGLLFQPDRPLLPHFTALPIAYHGRASTVEASPMLVRRPWGQVRRAGEGSPETVPTRALDFELELGAWVGPGNPRGASIGIDEADDHLFGLSLLNDWSARDVQGFEAVPLGPFLAKNFATTVSPWIVTMEALAPFRAAVRRDAGDPPLAAYLRPPAADMNLAVDLRLQAWLEVPGLRPFCVTDTRSTHGHWSFAQMLAHHTLNGCAMRPGDLLGSGTQSGPGANECGCLMERTSAGGEPLGLPGGGRRTMLEDGDTIVLRAFAERPGAVRIGFGECRGTVQPAGAGLGAARA